MLSRRNLFVFLCTLTACDSDLLIAEVETPPQACPGEDIGPASLLTVAHIGDTEITETVNVAWRLSSDPELSPDDRLLVGGRDQIPGLPANASVPVAINNSIVPPGTPLGPQYLLAVVDELDVVAETDETNNVAATNINIIGCDECNGSVPIEEADERVEAIAVDPSGDIYVAGSRARPAGFAGDDVDGFLRRLDPSGTIVRWDVAVDNCFWDTVNDIALTSSGDIALVGSTRPGAFASTPSNFMVRRYTPAGTLVWHVSPDTPRTETGLGLAVEPGDDAILVTGASSDGGFSVLLARVGAGGALEFSTHVAPRPQSIGRAIAVDEAGQIAVVGDSLGPSGTGSRLGMVARLDSAGTIEWVDNQGLSPATNTGNGVVIEASGETVALSTASTVSTPGASATQIPTLARYDATGAQAWAIEIDLGASYNPAAGLLIGPGDNLWLAGHAAFPAGSRPWLAEYTSGGSERSTRVLSGPTVWRVTDVASNVAGTHAYLAATVTPGPVPRTAVVIEPL
ncbi:MAG: hypothetical protein B7733_00050 [Myxococcales bacterium FL481]|nr:MAG: hypothetical protein B7733_00050 [Myxococcales bacterium FL481]